MSWSDNLDSRRDGRSDAQRGRYDYDRQHDWSEAGREYRRGYEQVEEERREEERAERQAEESRQEAHQRDLARQAQYKAEQYEPPEPEPEPEEPEPVVAAIQEVNGRLYSGVRIPTGEISINVNGHPLPARLDLANHSPTGFEWGYAGSGPAQLALAILAHHLKDDEQAVALHQAFKFEVVAKLPKSGWRLSAHDVEKAVSRILENKTVWP